MNKIMIIGSLILVVAIATSAYVPVAATENSLTSVTGGASLSGSGKNIIQLIPEVWRVGYVVAYIPGQSITIVDRDGNQFAFELDSPLKIVPTFRASSLAPGAFVTVIAPNNVPGGKHIAVGIVVHFGAPRASLAPSPIPTAMPNGTATPGPPVVFPPPETPLPPTGDKPDTPFSDPVPPLPPLPPLRPGIGYSFPSDFPDWAIAVRAAVFVDIIIDSAEMFTPVGVVEIDSNQTSPQIYLMEIDLVSTGDEVQGRLTSLTSTVIAAADTLDVTFQRMPQILNPERTDSPYEEFQTLDPAPTSFSTIFADGVCFVVTTIDGPIKYCSKPSGFDEPDSPLSVMDNFSSQYANLQDLIGPVADQFGLLEVIQLDQIVSMQEDIQHIQDCAVELTQQACGADLVVAPVSDEYFEHKYEERFEEDDEDDGDDESSSQSASIDVAVVKVLRPIETSAGTIQPGNYRVDYWFDSNGIFYAATLTGVTSANISVTNQQVPAVPASLINASNLGPQQPGAQISACRIFRRCLWFQSRCG